MHLTKRSHYNPCAWTALWNEHWFTALGAAAPPSVSARKQVVHALNVRSGRIRQTTVERVHYDEGIGTAEMTSDSMKEFCRRRFPSDYKRVAAHIDEHPETLDMDFEGLLHSIETQYSHRHFLEAAKLGNFASTAHKGLISCLLIVHAMRSHEFMTTMVEKASAAGMDKWEYFWLLKNAWGNRLVLARAVAPFESARWTLYRTEGHRFPLCDSPVMINHDNVMAILSPRLLAEIDLTVKRREEWTVRDGISASKYREFRRRAIRNTFKDIIFSDESTLEEWRQLPEFRARTRALANRDTATAALNEAAQLVWWALSGFGRVPDDFESWIGPILDAAPALPPGD